MSKEIKKIMPNAQVTGNSNPPRSGAFEVTLDGKLVYSKSPMRNPSHTHRTVGQPAEMAIQYGMASKEEMDNWHKAWVEWDETEGSEFVFECGEVLCWKGK